MSTPHLSFDWDQIRVFLAVARAGLLAGAAARLGLDVSTVSRRLDRLEADLGVHLFDRSRGGTTPTAMAEALLPAAEAMELALVQFTAGATALETTAEGVVRLTSPPGLADAVIAPLLARFGERFPRVSVELDASIGYADLTRREADLAIRGARPRSGELVAVRLLQTRAEPMTSPEYAATLAGLTRWDEARWIRWGEELSHLPSARWMTEHAGEQAPPLRTSHFGSQLRAAAAGVGVVLAPAELGAIYGLAPIRVASALEADLARLPLEDLWLVGHRALRVVPRVAALWDFLVEAFARPGGQGVSTPMASRSKPADTKVGVGS